MKRLGARVSRLEQVASPKSDYVAWMREGETAEEASARYRREGGSARFVAVLPEPCASAEEWERCSRPPPELPGKPEGARQGAGGAFSAAGGTPRHPRTPKHAPTRLK